MVIYELPISLYSFKLRLALKLKGVDIERSEPPGGTYRSPAYRAINPAGTIPALVDAQGLLAETDVIVAYLDDIGLGRPLRPADPRLAARHSMLSRWIDLRLEASVRQLFLHIAASGRDAAAVAEADRAISAALALIDGAMDHEGPFALGAAPGIADCGAAACLAWLWVLCKPLSLSASAGPRMTRVVEAMAEHPALAEEISTYGARVAAWAASRV
jgi:glutathione S-transferase